MLPTALLLLTLALPHPAPPSARGPEPVPPATTLRWGRVGHRAIAIVAEERLSPAAREAVRRLLGGGSLADASTWADSVRSERPEASPWHYVNIPVIDSVYRPDRYCPRGCVVSAYTTQLGILADRRRPVAERTEALRWVVHLLEDLHQPLHAGDRGDRGGNDVQVTFRGQRTNLHWLWDSQLLEALGYDDATLAVAIRNGISAAGDLDELTEGSVVDWVMQSHDISRDVVYPMLPADLQIGDRYLLEVLPALQLQLVRASARLTAVLDRALARG